jgi:hypothetical protein
MLHSDTLAAILAQSASCDKALPEHNTDSKAQGTDHMDKRTKTITLGGESLSIEQIADLAASWQNPDQTIVDLSFAARERTTRAHQALQKLAARGTVVYRVTTGFGRFKDQLIPADQARTLQRNLILSHAVGVGAPQDEGTVRAPHRPVGRQLPW